MEKKQPVLLDWLILLLLALVWGASFITIKKSLIVFTPVQAVFMRMCLASLAFLPLAVIYYKHIDWSKWKALVIVSLCGSGIPNYFFALGQQHISSSMAGILNSLTPFFTLIFGILFYNMVASRYKIAGVFIGLLGATILILFAREKAAAFSISWQALFCVAATICYAINANTVQAHLKNMHPAAIGGASFLLTTPFYLIGLFTSGAIPAAQNHIQNTPITWLSEVQIATGSLAYLGILGTAGASVLYFYLVQRTHAIFATSVTYLLPIMAMLLGFLDGEPLTSVYFLGTAIILFGLYITRKG